MRRGRLLLLSFSFAIALTRCTCGTDLSGDRFACTSDSDCYGADRCIAGFCGLPGGSDAGEMDSGTSDAGSFDGGPHDAGTISDAGAADAGGGGILLRQHGATVGANGGTTSDVIFTLPQASHSGDLLVVVGGWAPVTDVAALPTDNYGNKFTYILDAGPDQGVVVYYAQGIDGGAGHSVRWFVDGGTPLSLCVAEFSGVSTTNAYSGLVQFGNGSNAAPIAGPITPTVSGTLIFGALAHDGTVTTDAGAGFALLDIATDNSNLYNPAIDEYLVTSGTPASDATFSLSGPQIWADIVVAFNPGP